MRDRRTRTGRSRVRPRRRRARSASVSRSSSRVRASTRTRSRDVAVTVDTAGADSSRGRRAGRTPTRTVTICTGELASTAATSCPPNAGFHATRRLRAPSTSSPTASPVSPAPARAAARDATSRPQAVLGASTAHGCVSTTQSPSAACGVVLDRRALDLHDRIGTPRREATGVVGGEGDGDGVAVDLGRHQCGGAEQLAVSRGRSGSTTTATAGPDAGARAAKRRRRRRAPTRARARPALRAVRPRRAPGR